MTAPSLSKSPTSKQYMLRQAFHRWVLHLLQFISCVSRASQRRSFAGVLSEGFDTDTVTRNSSSPISGDNFGLRTFE